ncbi:Uma2 family endonuclease [Oscillatoria sp. FACHB-1406]|uniref:Uma2 family endonuclease n=1 Tax=Oscillatoria sp. FACHB-1406 TaxID=2692846 RepID=UPI00168498FA|nr:Uma2 family endonuclease [Oscillatoria sp. FACHB-1406]MBD2578155.1 Uma2 family endonuclease [Oscillatoria sp. FACHB-1406]
MATSQIEVPTPVDINYPDSDGKPMSDNTKQFRWITVIYYNLDWLFSQDENVFVAGDLLWYPVEGNNKLRQAPDVMVAFGVKKGDRGSYMQWKEGGIAPQVVFEILSPGNRLTPMNQKQVFYNRYGVEEYYVYDPDRNDLSGWLRGENGLDVIEEIKNWVSPRLGIQFDWSEERLQLLRPNGEPFIGYIEISQQLELARQEVEQERERAERERERAERERERAERLAERLKALGIDPEALD